MRRVIIVPVLALMPLCLSALVLAGRSEPALAAPVPAAPVTTHTLYLPLVLANSSADATYEVYPNDPYFEQQWGLSLIEAPKAWSLTRGRPTVLIAVLDSGIDLDHPDLADKLRTDEDWDFVEEDDVAEDQNGHGTHVAGIAAAATNNGEGIPGLGWEATLLSVRVLDAAGSGYASDLAAAIRYAADHGAQVINMSLGGPASCPSYVQSAVDYAYEKGVLLVAAAGNMQGNTPNFPANCNHVLGVAATNSDDTRASYSNYGSHVSIAAPGTSIYSTLVGGWYGYKSGTSMATPHVAGLAALVWARYPTYTPDQVASAILDNADDLDSPGWDMYTGCGRINAYQSLLQGAQGPSPRCLDGVSDWAQGSTATSAAAPYAPGRIILAFRGGTAGNQAALRYGTEAAYSPSLQAWQLWVPGGEEEATLARLQADPTVAYAELDYLITGW